MPSINWSGLASEWAPMLLLVGIWVLFMWQMQSKKNPNRMLVADYYAEMKRHNELVEQLIATLIERGDAKR